MKIKIVANNCEWESWPDKIKAVQDWYKPKLHIDFDILHTKIPVVPFIKYEDGREGVDPAWYDKNIIPLGMGYNIVLLVLPLAQWQSRKARGWRTDSDQGPVQLQVGCDENEELVFPNFPPLNSFFQTARHEIMHALYMITGQYDVCHFWWDRGQFEYARDGLKFPKDYANPFIQKALNYISSIIIKLRKNMTNVIPVPAEANRKILYKVAVESIGTDASPKDIAPDNLGCAETINAIYEKAFGAQIGGDVSTYRLYSCLKNHPYFESVSDPLPGDIIISPTGYNSPQNPMKNGHAGFVGENGVVMSNESKNGKFEVNYTIQSWRDKYQTKGGYPVKFFRRK